MDLKIVILDGYTLNPGDLTWAPFEKYGQVEVYDHTTSRDVINRARDADVLVVNKVILNEKIIQALPNLKAICVTATGMNNIDLGAAKKLNIPVFNVAGYGTESVAQHVFALILHFTNHVALHGKAVSSNAWSAQPHFSFSIKPMTELAGKTIGIYGFGNIGKSVARISKAFGMVVLVHSSVSQENRNVDAFVPLRSIFQKSDFVSLHAQLTSENQGIVNLEMLSQMKPEAILINTGRGGLINETDLEIAFQRGHLSAAALDVLNQEPPPVDHPFFSLPNVVVTPHNAWATKEARQRLLSMAADQLKNIVI
jgi:glycerate dehydrogenase